MITASKHIQEKARGEDDDEVPIGGLQKEPELPSRLALVYY